MLNLVGLDMDATAMSIFRLFLGQYGTVTGLILYLVWAL